MPLTLGLLALLLAAPPQEPASRPAVPPPALEQPAERPGYTYEAGGRRDPFVSLATRRVEATALREGVAGVPGLLVDDVAVKGIMRAASGFLAMIQAADGKTYIVHSGDRLRDGAVKAIAKDHVLFLQNADGPESRVRPREIAKRVRGADRPDEKTRTR